MTFEELKVEAKAQGYKLIKTQPYIKLLPCKCGRNRRQTWYTSDGMFYKCSHCGLSSSEGKTVQEARKNWNSMMEEVTE